MNDTWIKLYRGLLDWQWYTDANAMRVFMHLLLSANYKQNKWQHETIEAGQLITSVNKLSASLSLSTKQIRTALKKLESSNDIRIKGQTKYSLVTVVNWSLYQSDEVQEGKQRANEGQTKGKQRATLKESNKVIKREGNNIKHVASLDLVSTTSEINGSNDLLFDEFWLAYPSRTGQSKKDARTRFNAILKKGVDSNLIIQGANAYAKYCKSMNTENQYIKHAKSWLNAESWETNYKVPANQSNDAIDDWNWNGSNQQPNIKDVTPC